MTTLKPSWYSAHGDGKIADVLNLLHPPYTAWHLSYVLLGIALAPSILPVRSAAVLVSFFLGLGIGAHALDETMGNPLKTKLSKRSLYALGFGALSVAVLIGAYYILTLSILLLPFVLVETFFAVAYNLEIFQKRFHTTLVFALSWGCMPFLIGYFINALTITPAILLMAVPVALLTFVQKTLSTQARFIRRKIMSVDALRLEGGAYIPITSQELISPAEKSLKALSAMIFVIAIAFIFVLH